MRKTYTSEFKKKVVLEILKEEKTALEIATEKEVSPKQVFRWKKIVMDNMHEIFDKTAKGEKKLAELRKKLDESYAEIGKLTTQLNWLKKKCGYQTDSL